MRYSKNCPECGSDKYVTRYCIIIPNHHECLDCGTRYKPL